MKSLTAVRKKSPNYPVEFKIKMVDDNSKILVCKTTRSLRCMVHE